MSAKSLRRVGKALFILPKFIVDALVLQLNPGNVAWWFRINWRFKRPGLFPNLINPESFNDKMQWLKLFDQSEQHIICSDKLRVRQYVSSRAKGVKIPAVLWQGANAADIPWDLLPGRYVIKTNHDSGSVWLVTEHERVSRSELEWEINEALVETYGVDSLEWPYVHIEPQVFVEEYLHGDPTGDLPD